MGLVGALSIVRFRTPIKEPEELAYLFIAMGLGLGADQRIPTLVAGPLILVVRAVFKWTKGETKKKNLCLSLDWKGKPEETEGFLTQFDQVIGNHVLVSDLRRMDVREKGLEATYFIDVENPDDLSNLESELKKIFFRD